MIQQQIEERILVIDGAMGTMLQNAEIPDAAWAGNEGCNEILNETAPKIIETIHAAYLEAGADIVKTNTFGSLPWVLDEYGLGENAYLNAKAGAAVARKACDAVATADRPRYVAGSLGPGTKLPSLGHIGYDEMYDGYKKACLGLIDGGADLFLLETCQDPLQVKAALHACQDAGTERGKPLPVMVSVTIELSGTMLIGTDAVTAAAIFEPFDVLTLGFNCGTGPDQVEKHLKSLARVWPGRISVHANAGLPRNEGGKTVYPMGPEEFAKKEASFLSFPGLSIVGGCCGTTPEHIRELTEAVRGKKPLPSSGSQPGALASLFGVSPLFQQPAPFMIGERANATGSKAFRELLLAEDYEGTLSVAQQQVRSGAHGLDISVGFAGRDETRDMEILSSLYAEKVALPLMVDSTQPGAIEVALKRIGGRPIINSVNLEDGIDKFDEICALSKRYGTALVCLTIDEEGMAKTKERKVAIAKRMVELAGERHGIGPENLVFDTLTFTVGSGDEEYYDAAIQTIEAIREIRAAYPGAGAVLGVSNISFGLDKHAREYLNSVFLHHCVKAGLTMAIINVKNIIPLAKMSEEDIRICEDLLFNRREKGDPLFAFIEHFKGAEGQKAQDDEAFNKLSTGEKIGQLLIDGDKERMMPLLVTAKEEIAPEKIVNELLIDAMKVVGELFGKGEMQLPFVLQSAEVMKAAVDYLNPFLPKTEKASQTTLVLGTVKGDVHDVGKNLVDIILTNNGFRVVNIGIKADIESFVAACKEHDADAVGMSGLLVKSTQVMLDNLKEMKTRGLELPVLLGGAALTDSFIRDYCRPAYDGPVFYCKDAFDGITAMGRVEAGNPDVELHGGPKTEEAVRPVKEQGPVDYAAFRGKAAMPDRTLPLPVPPFWGRKVLEGIDPALAFQWLNKRILFKQRWGFKAKGMDEAAYEKLTNEKILPEFDRLKKLFLGEKLFDPTMIYGYWPVRSDGETLLVFDESEGWRNDGEASREHLSAVRSRAAKRLDFPRQQKEKYRSLADYWHADRHDLAAFTVVSSGLRLSKYGQELYNDGKYQEYYLVHGLGVELAEALAEVVHKQIRIELGLTGAKEATNLADVKMQGYTGCRYSPGYPACPELELNRPIFDLLRPEEFGIELSETFQIHPEQSTCALVSAHPEALYFNT